ncbi:winged helix-turn-helix transcriptional regulator [Cryptosporangium aurantiacum]|uniref:Transcriptional regulator, HxlR family n=1 Tax=Cryptosporangium aurantiacum TaxID=134849 RepID=A0A1M7TYD0_9ACTN|nr:helix-turn-helix domain-containing protein [Cryptosporangium aurantiacum]SHN75663.1 transcriptional regulator, HxlR family [Cryptosporangium aurantiacum]
MSAADRPRAGCRPLIDDKWSLVVISFLGSGPRRFTELRRGIDGISQRMLTVTLRSLERDGILVRTIHNVMPPNISYGLTPLGVSFLESVTPMLEWSQANLKHVEAARVAYDAQKVLEGR